ncbi:hypothetical protein D210916BOD24_11210 [Alteromonas sp. D210916BOD_24]|uniref:hypothetical protein n=1 Tax=Alteromonas sp. D210916BOD_24 TaxID=3157618 RepID=UPI00399C4CBF
MSTEHLPFDYIECINLIKQIFPDKKNTHKSLVRQRLIDWATQAFEKRTFKKADTTLTDMTQPSLTFKDILHIISEENNQKNKLIFKLNNYNKEAKEINNRLKNLLELATTYYKNTKNNYDNNEIIDSTDPIYSTNNDNFDINADYTHKKGINDYLSQHTFKSTLSSFTSEIQNKTQEKQTLKTTHENSSNIFCTSNTEKQNTKKSTLDDDDDIDLLLHQLFKD